MIHTIRTITVGQDECVIDRPIMLYRGDRDLEVEFSLVGNSFMFGTDGNVLASMQAKYAQLVVNTPSGSNMFSDIVACRKGNVIFTIRGEMIDEIKEVGMYAFQIRLLDATQTSRVTLPPVYNGIEIRQPIAAEDQENVTGDGVVDYAEMNRYTSESGPTFNSLGDYNKTAWQQRDIISTYRMNKIEDALYKINEHCRDTIDIHENQIAQLEASYNASFENVNKNINERIEYMQGEVNEAEAYVDQRIDEMQGEVNEAEAAMNEAKEEFITKINTVEAELTEHVNQSIEGKMDEELAHISNNIDLTPDDFDGTDIEKLQQAFDYAVENEIKTIKLNRSYDLTGGTVLCNWGHGKQILVRDGSLVKADDGFMFDRDSDDNECDSPMFENVYFKGTGGKPYVINGGVMIRQNFVGCCFSGVGCITTSSYIQSLRMNNCEMSYAPDVFIRCNTCYDLNITDNRFEASNNHLLYITSSVPSMFAINGGRISNNLIEGYTTKTPIVISSSLGLVISDNYFEANFGDIEFIKLEGLTNNIDCVISGNSMYSTKTNWHIKANGNIAAQLFVHDNVSNITKASDEHSFVIGVPESQVTNNYLYAGGRRVEKGTIIRTNKEVSYSIIEVGGAPAIRLQPKTNPYSLVHHILGETYFIQLKSTYGNSTYYRASYSGLLTIGGTWSSTLNTTVKYLHMTHLQAFNITGTNDISTNLPSDSEIFIFFEASPNNDKMIETTTNSDIIILFSKLKYNADFTEAKVLNISGILSDSRYAEAILMD